MSCLVCASLQASSSQLAKQFKPPDLVAWIFSNFENWDWKMTVSYIYWPWYGLSPSTMDSVHVTYHFPYWQMISLSSTDLSEIPLSALYSSLMPSNLLVSPVFSWLMSHSHWAECDPYLLGCLRLSCMTYASVTLSWVARKTWWGQPPSCRYSFPFPWIDLSTCLKLAYFAFR